MKSMNIANSMGSEIFVKVNLYQNLTDEEKVVIALRKNRSSPDDNQPPMKQIEIAKVLRNLMAVSAGSAPALTQISTSWFTCMMSAIMNKYEVRFYYYLVYHKILEQFTVP